MAQGQRQRDQGVEQHRQFELVAVAIGDLGGALRPIRLAERNVADLGLARDQRIPAPEHHAEQEREGEADLHEDRQQDHLDRHRNFPVRRIAADRH